MGTPARRFRLVAEYQKSAVRLLLRRGVSGTFSIESYEYQMFLG
jgi:hypothetical protein